MINKTDEFLGKIYEFSKEEFPKHTINRAKIALLDYLAVTSAGGKAIDDKLKKYIEKNHIDEGLYKLIGKDLNIQFLDSVFLNGLMAHTLDYDDGTNAGIIHLGSPIFTVLISVAKKFKIQDMQKFWRAAIIGYEASFTLANTIQPIHKSRGYHATGTIGVLGSIIAASYFLDFSFEQMENAFSIGALSSTGMLKVIDDNSELKPYNVAKTSLLSVISLQMSMSDFNVPYDVLGSERGFFSIMYGSSDVEFPKLKLNGTYAIEKAYVKPYAACRYCHPAIEAGIYLSDKYEINPENIKDIIVETYDTAVNGHDHTQIDNSSSAKMSIPYSVAVGIIKKKAGLKEFSNQLVKEEDIIKLTKKVKVKSDLEFSEMFPVLSIANVSIVDYNDNRYSRKVEYAKGEPENPLTESEFLERFFDLYSFAGKTKEEAKNIYDRIFNEETEFSEIYKLI